MPLPGLAKIPPHPLPRNLDNPNILDRRRHINRLVHLPMHRILHQLPQHPAQRLARPCLGDHAPALNHAAQRGDGADLAADKLLDLGQELRVGNGLGGGDKGEGEVAFKGIGNADDTGFGDERVGGDGLLEGACAEAVGGDVDDVVYVVVLAINRFIRKGDGNLCTRPCHDVDVALFVDPAGVASVDPFTAEPLHVALVEPLFVFPERAERGGGER